MLNFRSVRWRNNYCTKLGISGCDFERRVPVIQQYPVFVKLKQFPQSDGNPYTEEELVKIISFIEDSLELFYYVSIYSIDTISRFLQPIENRNSFSRGLERYKIHTNDFERRIGTFRQYNVFLFLRRARFDPLPAFVEEQSGKEVTSQSNQKDSLRPSCARSCAVASHVSEKKRFSRSSRGIQSTQSVPASTTTFLATTPAIEKPLLSSTLSSFANSVHLHKKKKEHYTAKTCWSSFVLPPVLSLPPFSFPIMECGGDHSWTREDALKDITHRFGKSFCSRKTVCDDSYPRIEHFRTVLGICKSENALLCDIEDGSAYWSLNRPGVVKDLLSSFCSFPSLLPISSLPIPIQFSEGDFPVPVYSTLSHSDMTAAVRCSPFFPCSSLRSISCGKSFSVSRTRRFAPEDAFYSLDCRCTAIPSTFMKPDVQRKWGGRSSLPPSSPSSNSHASLHSVCHVEGEKDASASETVRENIYERHISYKEGQDQQEIIEEEKHLRRNEFQKKSAWEEPMMRTTPPEGPTSTLLSSLSPPSPQRLRKIPLASQVRENEWCEDDVVRRAKKDPFLDMSMTTTTTANATFLTENEKSLSASFPLPLLSPSCRLPWCLFPSSPSCTTHAEETTRSERRKHSFLWVTSRLKEGVPLAVLSRCLTRLEHLRDVFLEYFDVICEMIRRSSPFLVCNPQLTDSLKLPRVTLLKNSSPSTTSAENASRNQEKEGTFFNGHYYSCHKFPSKRKYSTDFHGCSRYSCSLSSTSFEKISSYVFLAVCQRFYPLQVICSAARFWGRHTHPQKSLSTMAFRTLSSNFTSSSPLFHGSDVPLCACSRHRALTLMQWLIQEEKTTTTTQGSTTASHRPPCSSDCHSNFSHSTDRGNQDFAYLPQEDGSLFQEEKRKECGENHQWGGWSSIPWLIRCDVLMTYPKLSSDEQLAIMEELRQDYQYHYHQQHLSHDIEDYEIPNLHCVGSPCSDHELHDEVKRMASCADAEKSETTTRKESSRRDDSASPFLPKAKHSLNTSFSTNVVASFFREVEECAAAPRPSTCSRQTRATAQVLPAVAGRDCLNQTRREEESDRDAFERWWCRSDSPVPLYQVLIGLLPPQVEMLLRKAELQGLCNTCFSSDTRQASFPSCDNETENGTPSVSDNEDYPFSIHERKSEKRTTNFKGQFEKEQPSDMYAILRESMERHKKGGALRILWRGEGYLRVRSYYYSHWLKCRKQNNASEAGGTVNFT